jgi:hypothetical protein
LQYNASKSWLPSYLLWSLTFEILLGGSSDVLTNRVHFRTNFLIGIERTMTALVVSLDGL